MTHRTTEPQKRKDVLNLNLESGPDGRFDFHRGTRRHMAGGMFTDAGECGELGGNHPCSKAPAGIKIQQVNSKDILKK